MTNINIYLFHDYLNQELYKYISVNFNNFYIIKKFYYEEGLFAHISDNSTEKIIGMLPVFSNSIYTKDEIFIFEELTDNESYFIHNYVNITKRLKIICDELGGILCIDNYNSISRIKEINNINDYDIDYETFYKNYPEICKNKDDVISLIKEIYDF